VQFSPVSFHFVLSKSKYCPQRPVPVHPQPLLFCYCKRPSFPTHIKQEAKL
jgi:hypothetical protein